MRDVAGALQEEYPDAAILVDPGKQAILSTMLPHPVGLNRA